VFMMHKIISWNVRGLNERDKQMRINNLLKLWTMDIVCFQEMKMESISNCFV
jgi:exonuclease III